MSKPRAEELRSKGHLTGPPSDAYAHPEPPPPPHPDLTPPPRSDDWKDWGACRTADTDAFYPPLTPADGLERWPVGSDVVAKRYCAVCPVKTHCLSAGIYEQHGVWGGKTTIERRSLRRRLLMPTLEDIQHKNMPRHGTRLRALSGCNCAKCMKSE